MKTHGTRAWIDHVAGVWARSNPDAHQHKHGWERCPVCAKHAGADHRHDNGLATCRACAAVVNPTCGNPVCPICAA